MDYQVIVIGSGPGGYVAAIKAAQQGKSVAIIEKNELGGICLNWGCIPTKALLKSAEVYQELIHASDYGLQASSVQCDYPKVIERSRNVAGVNSKGVQYLMKKHKIQVLQGTAKVIAQGLVQITDPQGSTQNLKCQNMIIATGARARDIPTFPIDGRQVINYRHALELKDRPESILVIGSGAIGTEFSYFLNAMGTQVHLVEMQDHLLPFEDDEIAKILEQNFQKQGINTYVHAVVDGLEVIGPDQVKVTLHKADGSLNTLVVNRVLVAVGMVPNSENLGLEKAGITVDARGFIVVDEHMQTRVPGIYAIGDVTGRQMLAHKASAEAEVAVDHLSGLTNAVMTYHQIPACTYAQPQVASIGLTEKACHEQGLEIQIGRFPFQASGKARAIGHPEGLVKLIFAKPYGQLVGAHIIGVEATELLAELGLALKLECTWEEIAATIHAHPTLSEAIFEASLASQGKSPHL